MITALWMAAGAALLLVALALAGVWVAKTLIDRVWEHVKGMRM